MDDRKISLRRTLGAVSFVDCGDLHVGEISCDSRSIRRGQLFVAIPGTTADGRYYVQQAVAAGAAAVLLEKPVSGLPVPQCIVPDVRAAWARLCLATHRIAADAVQMVGVTGTNGKTTTTWLLRSILEAAGHPTALLGTIEYHDGRESRPARLTTPDASELAEFIAHLVRIGTRHCVMEISSHAIVQRRCAALPLQVAAVTNVTQDHFDYHGNLENYIDAKSGIARLLKANQPLLYCLDDPGCRQLIQKVPAGTPMISFGTESCDAVLNATTREINGSVQRVEMRLQNASLTISTHLAGRHNVLNCLVAAGLAEQLGIDSASIIAGIERIVCVPGRMERIQAGQPFEVFVDYAHSPDGLRHCVRSVRELVPGKVICVFGAGGDRDRKKRPLMAQAAQAADIVIVTSDNPRSEKPSDIIGDILSGFDGTCRFESRVDRSEAIRLALSLAHPGDAVVVAGRGHESMQQIGTRQISFDDRRVVRRLLLELMSSARPAEDVDRAGPRDWAAFSDSIPA